MISLIALVDIKRNGRPFVSVWGVMAACESVQPEVYGFICSNVISTCNQLGPFPRQSSSQRLITKNYFQIGIWQSGVSSTFLSRVKSPLIRGYPLLLGLFRAVPPFTLAASIGGADLNRRPSLSLYIEIDLRDVSYLFSIRLRLALPPHHRVGPEGAVTISASPTGGGGGGKGVIRIPTAYARGVADGAMDEGPGD